MLKGPNVENLISNNFSQLVLSIQTSQRNHEKHHIANNFRPIKRILTD